jgi:ATP adenylyltransferase
MKNLWAPWRMTYISGEDKQLAAGQCIFCMDRDHPVPDKERLILYAGRLSMVMMNRYPYTNGHLLVAPRRHLAALSDLSREEMGDILGLVSQSVEILGREMNPDGFNVGLNIGEVAGAGFADHLHFHIVPRWKGDTNFMTVFADVRVVPEHLEASFDRLVKRFTDMPLEE